MAKEFENAEETKVEVETEHDLTEQEKVDRMANRLAHKGLETEKKFDKDNSNLFTK